VRIEAGLFFGATASARLCRGSIFTFRTPGPSAGITNTASSTSAFPSRAPGPGRWRRVYLRTDDADYFGQMKEVFGACAFFCGNADAGGVGVHVDRFRARLFGAKGIQTLRAALPQTQTSMTGPPPSPGGGRRGGLPVWKLHTGGAALGQGIEHQRGKADDERPPERRAKAVHVKIFQDQADGP
jgi:hypothetical protein